jgi:hypothetical protein
MTKAFSRGILVGAALVAAALVLWATTVLVRDIQSGDAFRVSPEEGTAGDLLGACHILARRQAQGAPMPPHQGEIPAGTSPATDRWRRAVRLYRWEADRFFFVSAGRDGVFGASQESVLDGDNVWLEVDAQMRCDTPLAESSRR